VSAFPTFIYSNSISLEARAKQIQYIELFRKKKKKRSIAMVSDKLLEKYVSP